MGLRDKIIEAAYDQFGSIGFDNTTVEGIIKQVSCSKGGFYHHFKSKDEIVEEIVAMEIESLNQHFEKIIDKQDLPFLRQFNAVFAFIIDYKISQLSDNEKKSNIFEFSGNEKMRRRVDEQFTLLIIKTYSNVIDAGIKRRAIDIEYKGQVAELCARQVLWLIEAISRRLYNDDNNDVDALLSFSEHLIAVNFDISKSLIKYKNESYRYMYAYMKSMNYKTKEQVTDQNILQ